MGDTVVSVLTFLFGRQMFDRIILKLTALGRFHPLMQPHVYFEFTKTINISQKYPLNLYFSIYGGSILNKLTPDRRQMQFNLFFALDK